MSTSVLDGVKLGQDRLFKGQELKQKSKKYAGEIAIKKATLLGSLPSSQETAGDVALSGADRMSKGPQNAMNGFIEGLLRAFGGHLKGKSADEKREQLMNALDVMDYTMQGEEYLKNTQEQLAAKKESIKNSQVLSQGQYEQSYADGTLKPTITSMLQQMGVDPTKVAFSDDGLNVFLQKDDGAILKKPVSEFFSPEDSKEFQFINSVQKQNLAKSENKQLQGLAQENMQLKSRVEQLEDMYKNSGLDPATSRLLAEDNIRSEKLEEQKLDNETRKADASVQKANLESTYAPLNYDVRKQEAETASLNANTRLSALGLKNVKEVVPALRSINKGIHLSDEVMADAKNHPDIFRSALSAWINTNGDSGAFSLWAQKLAPGTAKEKDAFMRVTKNLNQLMITEVKGLGGGNNQTIDGWIKNGTLNTQYSVENVEHMLGGLKAELQFSEKLYNAALDHSGGSFISDSYNTHKKTLEADLKRIRDKTEGKEFSGGVKVKDPSTGRIAVLSPDQAKVAQQRGGVIIQ